MPIFCACVWSDDQYDAVAPLSLRTVDRKVRKIELLLEPVKYPIAEDATGSPLSRSRTPRLPSAACAPLASKEQPPSRALCYFTPAVCGGEKP